MKKENIIKYKKHILGVTGMVLAGTMIVAVSSQANADSKNDVKREKSSVEAVIPSAGIAKLLVNNQKDTNIKEQNNDAELVGGIATILNDYYAASVNEEKKLSVKAVDTVLKMLPEIGRASCRERV